MLAGMAANEDWETNHNHLIRSEKLYKDFEDFKQKRIAEGEADSRLIWPINSYITLCGRAGKWQTAVDTYYSIESSEPLKADECTYAALFDGLAHRKETDQKGELSITEQNAADAKYFWRRLEKAVEKGDFKPDGPVMEKFIRLLAGGRPADHQFGLEVLRDFVGLAAPGESAPSPRVSMTYNLLGEILEFCNKSKKYRLCISFFKQAMEMPHESYMTKITNASDAISDSFERGFLGSKLLMKDLIPSRRVVNAILIAQDQLAAAGSSDESIRAVELLRSSYDKVTKMRERELQKSSPLKRVFSPETVALALTVCWRCADWPAALETIAMASHTPVEELKDSAERRSPIRLDFKEISYLARTALASEDLESMRQFLRFAAAWRISSIRTDMHYAYYRSQYSSATVEMIEKVRASAEDGKEEYEELLNECKTYLEKTPRWRQTYSPEREETVFGSAKYVNKLSQAIDFEMATRNSQ